jgi:FAD/FMN-containing dehydrogenase
VAQWKDAAEDATHVQWAREGREMITPWASGALYLNSLGEGEGAHAVREAYGPNYQRLSALKLQFDPMNLFRMNQNIVP